MARKYFALKKRTLVATMACVAGLVALAVVLTPPVDVQAAGMFELETNFYTCPEDPSSLAECTWNGMHFRDCQGNHLNEGTLSGNYKINYSVLCNPPHIGSGSCFTYAFPGGWLETVCYP